MSIIIKSGNSGNLASVTTTGSLLVSLAKDTVSAGYGIMMSEVDAGFSTGIPYLLSPEVDDDYRLRISHETLFDFETFNYTAQNTGKHTYSNTTMTMAWTLGSVNTNSGNITTLNTGVIFGTYAYFPLIGASNIYCEIEAGFSAQPVTNTTIDFGIFQRPPANTTPYAPIDGAYFRMTAAGLQGVINYNGSETTTSVFTWVYNNSQKYQFIIIVNEREIEFWIDTVLYGTLSTPVGNGQPFAASALPFSVRHAIGAGAASGVMSFLLSDYTLSMGGGLIADQLGTIKNRIFGSYQGLSGGPTGSLSVYANSVNPTAAVPSNTALTANLPSGLGGQAWETFSLAVNTDANILSYQVPSGSASVQGKRLKITAVKLSSFVQTVLAGGPCIRTFALAFGSTAVTLAQVETQNTKTRRIVLLPELTQFVSQSQPVSTMISQPGGCISTFGEPIYVNPGEFISTTVKHIGTVGTSGTIATNIQYVYSWE